MIKLWYMSLLTEPRHLAISLKKPVIRTDVSCSAEWRAERGGQTDLVLVQVDVAGGGRVLVVHRHPLQALQHSPAALRSVPPLQSGRALTHAVQLLYNS